MIKLYQNCSVCNASGTYTPSQPPSPPTSCIHCAGTGYIEAPLKLDDVTIEDIFDKVKKIKKTVDDIWNKVK